MHDRGVIRNRQFKQQIADFSGIKFGKITPTDIDMFVEFGDKLYVFAEAKYGTAKLSGGQEWAIERLCDACHIPPTRYAVFFVVSHSSDGDIDYANTIVTRYRWNAKWVKPKSESLTLIEGINSLRKLLGIYNVVPFGRDT